MAPLDNPVRPPREEPLDVADVRNSLKSLMWRNVGVSREAFGIEDARKQIERFCRYVLPRQFDRPEGWELQNLLTIAGLCTAAALERTESRGVHQRSDHPDPDDAHWLRHLTHRRS